MSHQPDPAAPLTFTTRARINEWSHNPIGGWAQPTLEVGLRSAYGDGGLTFHGKLSFVQVPAALLPAAYSWQDAVVEVTFKVLTPQSRVVPWKPEEVPLGAWFQRVDGDTNSLALLGVHKTAITLAYGYIADDTRGKSAAGSARALSVLLDKLAQYWRYSIDGGKTWKPAGRVEVVHV